MTPLPNDCSRCPQDISNQCPRASTCRRTTPPRGETIYVSYTMWPGGEDCHGYWPEDAE